MAERKTLTATFIVERATKNKIVYQEVDGNDKPTSKVIGALYVSKTELGENIPGRLKGTFEVLDK